MHGLNGTQWSRKESAEQTEDEKAWFVDRLADDQPKTRVSAFEYNLFSKDSNIFVRPGIRTVAIALLDAILELKRKRDSDIILVGHDIGGVIIKEVVNLLQSIFPSQLTLKGNRTSSFWAYKVPAYLFLNSRLGSYPGPALQA